MKWDTINLDQVPILFDTARNSPLIEKLFVYIECNNYRYGTWDESRFRVPLEDKVVSVVENVGQNGRLYELRENELMYT